MKWLFGLFAKSDRLAGGSTPSPRVQTINPNKLLFSIPTLAGDLAALEPIDRPPQRTDVVLSEDDWSQLEFFPHSSLGTVQRHLTELKAFEQANRKASGWRNAYVRRVERSPVVRAANPIAHLEQTVGARAGAAPFITAAGAVAGRVRNGFAIDLGGNTHLYGYIADGRLPVLAASVGAKADNMKLASAFMKLNKSDALMLVDWRAQLLLVGVSAQGSIETWKP